MKEKQKHKRRKKGSSAMNGFGRLRAWQEAYREKWKQQDVQSFGAATREMCVVVYRDLSIV